MQTIKWFVTVFLSFINRFVLLPVLSWAAAGTWKDLRDAVGVPDVAKQGYVEPASDINALVVLAAYDDDTALWQAEPERAQAILNACVRSLRADKLSTGLCGMFAGLAASGHPPPELILRFSANTLMLGMSVQRRLDRPDVAIGRDSSNPEPSAV